MAFECCFNIVHRGLPMDHSGQKKNSWFRECGTVPLRSNVGRYLRECIYIRVLRQSDSKLCERFKGFAESAGNCFNQFNKSLCGHMLPCNCKLSSPSSPHYYSSNVERCLIRQLSRSTQKVYRLRDFLTGKLYIISCRIFTFSLNLNEKCCL